MPEKIRTKFAEAPSSTSKSTTSQRSKSAFLSAQTDRKATAPTNGTKRLRDGSPKPAPADVPSVSSAKGNSTTGPQANPSTPRGLGANGAKTSARMDKAAGATSFTRGFMNSSGVGARNNKPTTAARPNEKTDRQSLRKVALQLEKDRKNLPIWSKKADIRWALRHNDVLLLHGETGSGKSTQVPQFLYTEPWCVKKKVNVTTDQGVEKECLVGGIIAITQPRRVAATTLAHRVAREMGSPLVKGCGPGEVGYAVRFESVMPAGAKIKFLTEGMLLQEMLHDPDLRKYSAVIVDEIHERSVDVDLIAGFLRTILHGDKKGRGGVPLKVVIMSATFDLGGIEAFFATPGSRPDYAPGQNHGRVLAPHMVEFDVANLTKSKQSIVEESPAASSWEGFSDSDGELDSQTTGTKTVADKPKDLQKTQSTAKRLSADKSGVEATLNPGDRSSSTYSQPNGVAVEYVRGRQYEVDIIYEVNPCPDYLHNILQTVLQLHVTEPLPGDILVFLTGQDEIETLRGELEMYAEKIVKTLPRMKVMPLYGALTAQAQQDAFEKVKEKFTRKVVLATNIAETSVTVSGVRFVVDCGKSKVKQYRPRLGMESLLAKPISRVSAIQRAGRAGREAKGKCYRVYTEEDYLKLDQDELPEILRSDVIEAVLKMKSRGVGDVLKFPLMDSPDVLAIQNALKQLHMMGAIDDGGSLTPVGQKMAAFPLSAAYARVLIAAAEPGSDILLEAIDVVSCLTTDSEIFLQPKSEDDQEKITEARKDIIAPDGDVVTLLAVMGKYASENSDRGEWCRQRLVSTRAMKMAMQIRKQLRQLCHQQHLLAESPPPDPQAFEPLPVERVVVLLKAFMKAFAAKTALLAPDGSYVMTVGRNQIAVHPSSVLYGQKKSEAIMFLDHVFTAKNYAKKVSPVQANWIVEAFDTGS